LGALVSNASNDGSNMTSTRIPDDVEVRKLFEYAYEGKSIDF
jgi:hypothetical protein